MKEQVATRYGVSSGADKSQVPCSSGSHGEVLQGGMCPICFSTLLDEHEEGPAQGK